MASLVNFSRFDANASSTGGSGDASLTVASGDTLVAIVTYTNGDATVTLSSTWGTWTEATSLQVLSGNRWRVYYINNASAATGTPSLTLSAARDVVGLLVLQIRGTTGYLGGSLNTQSAPGTGSGILTSNSYSVSPSSAYAVGLCWDMSALSGEAAPTLNSTQGFTERLTAWVLTGAPNKLRAADKSIGSGNVVITFDSAFSSHAYRTMVLAFSTVSLTGSPGQWDPTLVIQGWF